MGTEITLADLMPAAVGIALSPLPIAAVILMLFTDRARSNSLMFVVGWLAGLLVAGGLLMVLGGDSMGSDTDPSTTSLAIKTALGLLLLIVAIKQWRGRPTAEEELQMPKWMESISSFSAVQALGIAALLSGINPKNLALNALGVVTIQQAELSTSDAWVAFLIFVALSSVTVILPVAYFFIAGKKAEDALDNLKTWLIANNTAVMAVLFLVFGVKLLSDGVAGLLA